MTQLKLDLYLGLVHPQMFRKIVGYAERNDTVLTSVNEQIVLLKIQQSEVGKVLAELGGVYTDVEMESINALLVASGTQLKPGELTRVTTLDRLVAMNHARWIPDLLVPHRYTSVFQPVFQINSGVPFGLEAFFRLTDEQQKTLSTQYLFDIAENTEFLSSLDDAAIASAIGIIASVRVKGITAFFLNCRPRGILDPAGWAKKMLELTRVLGIRPQSLVVELSLRRQAAQMRHYRSVLRAVQDVGFLTSIDDIGSNDWDLAEALELNPSFLKFDVGLTTKIDEDPFRQIVVSRLVREVSGGSTKVIAKSVETSAEHVCLKLLGVENQQGRFFADAYSVEQLLRLSNGDGLTSLARS
jgi:EAL domain-containing protein (putative c-di-GMP-specific phosphodiesterase class I)